MHRVLGDRSALAVTVFCRGEHHLAFVIGDDHRDDPVFRTDLHAADTAGRAAHRTHFVFIEAKRLASVREEHHAVGAICQIRSDQHVTFIQSDR